MVETDYGSGRWTLPGGGVEQHETFQNAARREVWEETGATVEIGEELFQYSTRSGFPESCFRARLIRLEPSPKGRRCQWIEPLNPDWRNDRQIKLILERTSLFGGGVA